MKGYKNTRDYLLDPATLGEPQPDPLQQAQLAKIQKETEVAERQMKLREVQVENDLARKAAEAEWKRITGQHQMALDVRDADRRDAETANRVDISLAELELALDARAIAAPENTKLTAIASPNS